MTPIWPSSISNNAHTCICWARYPVLQNSRRWQSSRTRQPRTERTWLHLGVSKVLPPDLWCGLRLLRGLDHMTTILIFPSYRRTIRPRSRSTTMIKCPVGSLWSARVAFMGREIQTTSWHNYTRAKKIAYVSDRSEEAWKWVASDWGDYFLICSPIVVLVIESEYRMYIWGKMGKNFGWQYPPYSSWVESWEPRLDNEVTFESSAQSVVAQTTTSEYPKLPYCLPDAVLEIFRPKKGPESERWHSFLGICFSFALCRGQLGNVAIKWSMALLDLQALAEWVSIRSEIQCPFEQRAAERGTHQVSCLQAVSSSPASLTGEVGMRPAAAQWGEEETQSYPSCIWPLSAIRHWRSLSRGAMRRWLEASST